MNALNAQVMGELELVFAKLHSDEQVRCVVLTGEGEKAFVAGADIKEMENFGKDDAFKMSHKGQKIFSLIENFRAPVIAAVNGFALGGGLELALSCDFIIAHDKARFAFPEVGLGLIPGYGGTQRLSRVIGKAKAKRMALSGEMIKAKTAYEWGLVTEVTEASGLMTVAYNLAEQICEKAPLAVSWAKKSVNLGFENFQAQSFDIEAELFSQTFLTEDKTEGISAFVEKRKANFKSH